MPKNNKEKSDKFRELAESRVNRAINMIRLIANLGNKAHYDYSADQAKKIVNAFQGVISEKDFIDFIEKCYYHIKKIIHHSKVIQYSKKAIRMGNVRPAIKGEIYLKFKWFPAHQCRYLKNVRSVE